MVEMSTARGYARFWGGFLAVLLAAVLIAVTTAVCLHLHLKLAAPLCLDLIVVVLVSLRGSFTTSAFASIAAVACLDYFFAEPIYSLKILDPLDGVVIVLFAITAGVITTLVSRLRENARQMAATNATLAEQIAEVRRAGDQINLARVNRVLLMGEMTASIAHEVNQPLTGILANAGTALRYLGRETPNLEEAARCLGLIVRDSKRAGEVISRIRALARKAPPRTREIQLNETIADALALTRRDLDARQIDLEVRLAPDLPVVSADGVQLQQVLLNLILNAVEAMTETPDGPRELVVQSGRLETNVFVEIRDSGGGLDPATLDRLFTSFYTTKNEGMGMGLSISRSIVEAHGGRLWAVPNEPRGAIFRFTVPLDEAHA
jgi:signal transduction histidine kinase